MPVCVDKHDSVLVLGVSGGSLHVDRLKRGSPWIRFHGPGTTWH